MYVYYNPNPNGSNIGDCVIRALSFVLEQSWDETYLELMELGYKLKDMPSANYVWGADLLQHGFVRYPLPNSCPYCYTVKQFCKDNPHGMFVLGTGSHVIAVKDGNYYDSWDSGNEVPSFVYGRGD